MYSKSITRKNRALFVITIDQSSSMADLLTVGLRTNTKAEMVTEVANDLISELLERSRRSEGVRDYYDIAVIGYSGEGVQTLLSEDNYLSISELSKRPPAQHRVRREYQLSSGERRLLSHLVRSWIEPKATGSTPMYEALLLVHEIVKEWCSKEENWDSFPPIIFNITDGESTDCGYDDIYEICSKIKTLATNDGAALLFNTHIASTPSACSLLFPSLDQITQLSDSPRSALSLYRAASDLPPIFREAFCDIREFREQNDFKALCFNCSISELVTILNIGSISVKCK